MPTLRHALFSIAALCLASSAVGADDSPTSSEAWTALPASAWRWYGHKKEEGLPKVWTVEADGSLHHAAGDGRWTKLDLVSIEAGYRDFVFEFEWKVGKGANSGVLYRINEDKPLASTSGFEYQVLDDEGFEGGKAAAIHRAGALYGVTPANKDKALKPVGEWNTSRIVADGSKLEHWLNGQCVVRVDLDSAEFKAAFAKSQWKGDAAKGAAPNGLIALQDHGGEVWYRNIRVRKLGGVGK